MSSSNNAKANSPSWKLRNENRRKSIDSTQSNDQSNNLLILHHDEVIDAMGLITDESSSFSNGNLHSDFNDNRRFSEIHPDQKMIRPIRNQEIKSKNSFTQQSFLLSHNKDRYRTQTEDYDYGSLSNKNNSKYQNLKAEDLNNKDSTPFPIPNTNQNHPYIINKKYTAQRSLLSQSVPISTVSDNYLDISPNDENSIYASSNPSSRRSSNASSLNDVCFPVDSLNEVERFKKWPNLAVLEEFSRDELNDLKIINSSSVSQKSGSLNDDSVNFQYPIVSNVDYGDITEPLIVSTNEEIDPINGRLRPKKMTPWNKPQFITKQEKLSKFRFTYFREDLPDTIHSPNISGLLHNGKKFQDLFSPDYYGSTTNESIDEKASNKSNKLQRTQTASLNIPTPTHLTHDSTNTIGSVIPTPKPTYVQPFWLDILNPTEDEMKVISKTFGIHPLTSEDIFLGEAREKVELFKDYYFVCFTSFDVEEEHQRRRKAAEKAFAEAVEEEESKAKNDRSFFDKIMNSFKRRSSFTSVTSKSSIHSNNSRKSRKSDLKKSANSLTSKRLKKRRYNKDELIPLTMYMVIFRDGIITFHFKPTPHTGNVRRRARLLRDYLTVSSDWVCYALIDDITDAFAPLIESIETEVNAIEDEIITMQSGDNSDSESEDDTDTEAKEDPVWIRVKRRNSNISGYKESIYSNSTNSTSSSSADTKIISWKRKGDMLRRIGDCRRRVMSVLRLLGSKADVIKGFSKRYNEQWEVAPRTEIGLYLGDIQDHILTMVQNLNHYEKLLARSHSNYLAQINIDMTKVNNDMNDILGKITILGTIVLPLNIVTGLWGMNCIVPGQDVENLNWFWTILTGMFIFSITCYYYVKRIMNIV